MTSSPANRNVAGATQAPHPRRWGCCDISQSIAQLRAPDRRDTCGGWRESAFEVTRENCVTAGRNKRTRNYCADLKNGLFMLVNDIFIKPDGFMWCFYNLD